MEFNFLFTVGSNLITNAFTNVLQHYYVKQCQREEKAKDFAEEIEYYLTRLPKPGDTISARHITFFIENKEEMAKKVFRIGNFLKIKYLPYWNKVEDASIDTELIYYIVDFLTQILSHLEMQRRSKDE